MTSSLPDSSPAAAGRASGAAAALAAEPTPGLRRGRCGQYLLEDLLGRGGMGDVYRARDTVLGRRVALKFLPPGHHHDAASRARFLQEARAASALHHPNVATIYEIGHAPDGAAFIAMEYCPGETLRDRIARGPLPLAEALDYALQIARGLQHAHEAEVLDADGTAHVGVVHRDVKPANVLVTPEGGVKILDFGLAKITDLTLTQAGTTLGTALYMSPEQAQAAPVDARADLWALGVMLYEMLAGERPFRGGYEQAVFYAILHDAPPPLPDTVPQEVAAVVAWCLEKDRDQRPPSARALAERLAALHPARSDAAPLPSLRRAHRRQQMIASSLLAGLVALAVVAATWLLRPGVPDTRYIAVLPFEVHSSSADDRVLAAGLHDALTNRLSQLDQFQDALSVVPASETRSPLTPTQARKKFGATVVVEGSARFEAGQPHLTLNLIDATTLRIIDSENVEPAADVVALQDAAVLKLAEMLQVNLLPDAREVLLAGGTPNARANTLYLRGKGLLRDATSEYEVEQAVARFEEALREDPRFALAAAGLGEAYWERYRLTYDLRWARHATESLTRALALDAQLAPVQATLGLFQRSQQHYEEALAAYTQALALAPRNAAYFRGRAHTYRDMGRPEDAEADYRHALALQPNDYAAYYSYANFFYQQGRLERAREYAQRSAELAPANPHALNLLGNVYWALRRTEQAKAFYERSLAADSTLEATANLAMTYFYDGQYEEAARLYARRLRLYPHDFTFQTDLANALYWMPGQRADALAGYRNAIALAREHLVLFPEDPVVLGALATAFARLGEADSARAYLRAFEGTLTTDDANAHQLWGVGETYLAVGDTAVALGWMERALARGFGWYDAHHSPWLTPLHDHPPFARLLAAYAPPQR